MPGQDQAPGTPREKPEPTPCIACRGSGFDAPNFRDCPSCNGMGWAKAPTEDQSPTPVQTAPSYRVEKLVEPAECATCGWQLEPGDSVLYAAGEAFCGDRCFRKATFAPEHDLGGEA